MNVKNYIIIYIYPFLKNLFHLDCRETTTAYCALTIGQYCNFYFCTFRMLIDLKFKYHSCNLQDKIICL